ncbi:TPA: conjugal transfer mating pair stabilization protein TraN [Yersinia enterocolitica]|uniref:conjugal transfer mating pair stabilization protein TraN n=1 Tax=Escherichia coli TaxID=562 RepID=UPI000DE83EEC|nr:conjugal transfer mating pair stabilization protein TraN [Escherichia coli]HBX6771849.1 conjugal transfer mating pair stabilization protein TraN [Klebsiella pneumoniae]HDL8250440.1 conjugal transfer mating pair stabilization protein TraN [Yersinia enterocolitica]RBX77608.1 conjugal transfer protein TraN [Escherichia coli]RBY39082.1 conjugal transfer protein TraN [Escherichia coli]HBX6778217.1 conjugal transfer mating pair stabilization protein TraN [Klebsiella pneumoniae]
MRSHNYFMRAVASLLTVTMSALPIHTYANGSQDQDITAVGKEAQAFGQNLSNSFKSSSGTVQNGTISMPTLKDGQFQMNGGSQINVNDLFPGTSGTNNKPDSYYFPDANKPDVGGLQGIYDSGDNMDSVGNSAKGSLWGDANSANPSISGAAYKVLLDASNRSRPDFSNDPILNLSKKTYEDMDLIAEGFGDCSAETTISQGTINTHVPEYERCQRVIKPTGDCDIIHSVGVSSTVENVYVASQGRTWFTVQFDLKNGSWKAVSPSDGERKVAQIPTVDYNAMCSGAVNFKTDLIGSWDWPEHGIPGKIDSTVIYRVNQYPTCDNGLVGVVQIQDTTASDDLDWVLGGRFSFRFTKQEEDKWIPQSCIDDAKKLQDGFCSGSIDVVEGARNDVDCIVVNGATICPGDSFYNSLKPSPLPGIPKLAQKVRLSKLQCDFNVGQMECWTDPQGVEHCPNNDGSNLNSCSALESNPQCGFISSECVDGAAGSSGQCYVFKDTYDCGTDVDVPTLEKNTEFQCGGPIRCMGDDCLDITKSQSADFARATALLNAAQFLTQDMSCTDSATEEGGDGNVDQGCTVFGGEAGECKIAVGGVSDCCEKPTNISLADYLNLIMAVPKLDGAVMGLTDGNALKGAYQVLREPALQGWTEVTKPFTSYIENVSGAVDSFFQPVEQFVDQLIDQLKEQVKEVMMDVMKSAGQDAATEQAAAAASEQAAEAMMESAATWLSTAMTIYTVYVVAMVMIQMIYACEEEEFTMNAKRALKNCTYVGSYCKSKVLGACIEEREAYCCFNSPLSRIIQEQIRPQLGESFGSPKEPQCGGIPLEKVAEIDWSKINLDEWLGILQQNGKFPDPSSINLDSLTGSGNDFNIDGTRKNSQERALERLQGIDVDAKRREATNSIEPQTGAPTSGGGGG